MLGLVLVLLALLSAGAWAGYTFWRNRQLARFEPACREALQAADWPRLDRLASAWAGWEPQNADPWIFWAEAQQQQGNYEQASRLLERLPDEHPRTVPALLERSTLLFGPLNRPFEGVATCERILRLEPRQCEARQRLIFFYAQTLQRRKLVREIHAALDTDCDLPENYVYLLGTDWITFSNGYELNNRWLTAEPENPIFLAARAMHFVHSAGLQDSANPALAKPAGASSATAAAGQAAPEHEQIMLGYLQRFPDNMELLAFFLDQAVNDGDLQRVAELLRQAPAEAVDDNRFWRCKGWLLGRQGKTEQAEESLREALARNPYDWIAQHQMAGVLRQSQRLPEVDRWERLSTTGRDLRKALLRLPDARSVPAPLLEQMADYFEACGQVTVAQKLRRRIDGIRLIQ
ncbi:MAG: tetratricopeptide repeat protein [Pirellulaceae bacterium]|nr:tetratricopeptide repeat protein [Pirellulaceae bacterium]